MANPIAGWYPDPSGDQTKLRWWDGNQWTDNYADAVAPQQPMQPQQSQQVAQPQQPAQPVAQPQQDPRQQETAQAQPSAQQAIPHHSLNQLLNLKQPLSLNNHIIKRSMVLSHSMVRFQGSNLWDMRHKHLPIQRMTRYVSLLLFCASFQPLRFVGQLFLLLG